MIVIIPALAYTGQALSIISIFRLFPLNIRFPVLKDMIALAFIVLYLSFSTIANVCLSVCPFICHKANPFNSLKSSSFIINPACFFRYMILGCYQRRKFKSFCSCFNQMHPFSQNFAKQPYIFLVSKVFKIIFHP